MKHFLFILLLCMLITTSGCSRRPEAPQPETLSSVQYATVEPDSLATVLDYLYTDNSVDGLFDANADDLTNLFHMESTWVDNYAIRYSSGRYGVADVAIIKPREGYFEDVVSALELRRSDRIAEFENYDIHDALSISKGAEIFSRGDYVIMLMIADSDGARTKILEQIPG